MPTVDGDLFHSEGLCALGTQRSFKVHYARVCACKLAILEGRGGVRGKIIVFYTIEPACVDLNQEY